MQYRARGHKFDPQAAEQRQFLHQPSESLISSTERGPSLSQLETHAAVDGASNKYKQPRYRQQAMLHNGQASHNHEAPVESREGTIAS